MKKSSLNDFYNSILNIGSNKDYEPVILNIVSSEVANLSKHTDSIDGFCKYLAEKISIKLDELGIRNDVIDLNKVLNIDHVFIICEYMYGSSLKRFLIDPTYTQFTKKENMEIVRFDVWPSEKLSKDILEDLLNKGMTQIDSERFSNYLSSFRKNKIDVNLDEFLMKLRMIEIGKVK